MSNQSISITSEEDYYDIKMTIENKGILSIRILENRGTWDWFYLVRTENVLTAKIKEKKFVHTEEQKVLTQKVNDGFYQMFRYLKNHPEYRLKIMSLLDDDAREIWNEV